jgi:hypothetical protein
MVPTGAESAATRRRLLHTMVRLLVAHPAWVLAHAQGYAGLTLELTRLATTLWQRRWALQLMAGACALIALALAGVAAMLWATAPPMASSRLLVLIGVPMLPVAAALATWHAARRVPAPTGLDALKQQWDLDLAVLQEATLP